MAIPLAYNLRSVRERWTSAVVAVLGIAGTVGGFVAMLALANGFRATLVSSGSPPHPPVRRAGSRSPRTSDLERGRDLRRRGQRLRLRGVVRRRGAERHLPAAARPLPIRHRPPDLGRRLSRLQGGAPG